MIPSWLDRHRRLLRGRFGVAAPEVVVRGRLSGYWQLFFVTVVAALAAIVTWLAARPGDAENLVKEVVLLREDAGLRQEELTRLRALVGTEQSALAIERAAQRQMLERIASLESESTVLKEEVLLLERLLTGSAEESVVRVESFRVLRDGDSKYRYRLMFAYRPSRALPEFRGRLQIAVTYSLNGGEHGILVPVGDGGANERLELRHFARREGVFRIPEGAVLLGAEVKLFQGDRLAVSQRAQL